MKLIIEIPDDTSIEELHKLLEANYGLVTIKNSDGQQLAATKRRFRLLTEDETPQVGDWFTAANSVGKEVDDCLLALEEGPTTQRDDGAWRAYWVECEAHWTRKTVGQYQADSSCLFAREINENQN